MSGEAGNLHSNSLTRGKQRETEFDLRLSSLCSLVVRLIFPSLLLLNICPILLPTNYGCDGESREQRTQMRGEIRDMISR